MFKSIVTAVLFLFSYQSLAKEIPLIQQDRPYTLEGSAYIFLNHSTQEYDGDLKSVDGVKKLLALGKAREIPVIVTKHNDAFVEAFSEEAYFIKSGRVQIAKEDASQRRVESADADIIVHSDGGAHRLQFPKANLIIMGGGNLRNCLCESVRDVVAGLGDIQGDKEIFLVREATYDYDVYNENMPETKEAYIKFVNKFFLPNFNCPYQTSTGYGPVQNVGQVNLKFSFDGKVLVEKNKKNAKGTVTVHLMSYDMMIKSFGM